MNSFRSILALFMALLVMWPLCCCSARALEPEVRHSCCSSKGGDSPDQQEHPDEKPYLCACPTQEPREMAKMVEPPVHLAPPFVPVVQEFIEPGPPANLWLPASSSSRTCDPPRLLLARFSRWLI